MHTIQGLTSILFLIYLGFIGLGIYTTILVIKALKVYIKKNS